MNGTCGEGQRSKDAHVDPPAAHASSVPAHLCLCNPSRQQLSEQSLTLLSTGTLIPCTPRRHSSRFCGLRVSPQTTNKEDDSPVMKLSFTLVNEELGCISHCGFAQNLETLQKAHTTKIASENKQSLHNTNKVKKKPTLLKKLFCFFKQMISG